MNARDQILGRLKQAFQENFAAFLEREENPTQGKINIAVADAILVAIADELTSE